jgi:hypothetical protein
MADQTVDFRPFNSKIDELITALNKNTEASAKPSSTGGTPDTSKNQKLAAESLKKFGASLTDLASSAMSLASKLGVTAVRGVELELAARTNAAAQFVTLGANIAATSEQIKAVYAATSDAFINFPAGMTVSAEASAQYASELKRIFGSEFALTSNTLRNFGVLGLTTTDQLQQFKDSTGRAGFSGAQLDRILSKNIASLLIFGNNTAKSAISLEQIGVSLEQYRSVQQGTVTNLEGTLDTVNQLNQLGAKIDFEQFVRLSELGTPEETFRYLQSTIPAALLRTSTSFRALAEQIPGVKVEDLLRGGMESSVKTLEQRLTELAQPDGPLDAFTDAIIRVTRGAQEATGIPGSNFAVSAGKFLVKGAAIAAGAYFGGPAGATAAATGVGTLLGNDVVSSYGDRTLVTPKGNIALNNNDTVIAGTNLMPRGAVQMADNSALMNKIDNFINTINNATTTINIDGRVQTVNRIQLAEVNTRYQRA